MKVKEKVFKEKPFFKKYGTEKSYEKLKKGGYVGGTEKKSAINKAQMEWKTVEENGRGKGKEFHCKGKLNKKQRQQKVDDKKANDKRKDNGKELIGEFELKSLVTSYLAEQGKKVKPMSSTRWTMELGLSRSDLKSIIYDNRYDDIDDIRKLFKKHGLHMYSDKLIMNLLDDFANRELKQIQSRIGSTFNRLKKEGILNHKIEEWGCDTDNEHRKLKKKEVDEIKSIKSSLMKKYGLKPNQLNNKRMEKVKKYNNELEQTLSDQLGIKYDYKAHKVSIKDMDKLENADIMDGLKEDGFDDMVKDYKKLHNDHSLGLAKNRDKTLIKCKEDNYEDSINFIKMNNEYSKAWDILLDYYITGTKYNPVVEEDTTESKPKSNPLQHFNDIKKNEEVLDFLKANSIKEESTVTEEEWMSELGMTPNNNESNIEEDLDIIEQSMNVTESEWMSELGII